MATLQPPLPVPASKGGQRSLWAGLGIVLAAVAITLAWLIVREPVVDSEVPVLSVFEPHAGGCAWSKLNGRTLKFESIVHLPSNCPGVRVAFRPGGGAAVLWFLGEGEGGGADDDAFYSINTRTNRWRRLPSPTPGETHLLGWDHENGVWALTIDNDVELDETAGPAVLRYRGKPLALPPGDDGPPVVAHALRLEGERWVVVDTRASRCCGGDAPGINVLPARTPLGKMRDHIATREAGSPEVPPFFRAVEDPDLKGLLAPLERDVPLSGPWLTAVRQGWGSKLAIRTKSATGAVASGEAYLIRGTRLEELPGRAFGPTDTVNYSVRRTYLLATTPDGGEPHLYDMNRGHLVWSSRVAQGTVFWPLDDPGS